MFPTSPQLLEVTLLLLLVDALRGTLVAHRREPQRCAVVRPARRPRPRPQRLRIDRR